MPTAAVAIIASVAMAVAMVVAMVVSVATAVAMVVAMAATAAVATVAVAAVRLRPLRRKPRLLLRLRLPRRPVPSLTLLAPGRSIGIEPASAPI
jgi:hypothetical protein